MNKITYAGMLTAAERQSRAYELVFPESGGTVLHDGGTAAFEKESVIIVPPRKVYRIEKTDGLLIVLQQALLPQKEISVFRDDKDLGAHFAAKQAEKYFSESGENGAILSALGNLIASYAAELSPKTSYSPVVETIRSEIERYLTDPTFNMDDRIKRMPLNYDYVRKLFKKETGQTPHAYLLGKRMELAAAILTSGVSNQYSGYSVSQVAESCGFSEPLYFSRVFKKYYGVSPSEFRNKK